MSKRSCPFDDNIQDIKRQTANGCKARGIRSEKSEKVLQLLYHGANKQYLPQTPVKQTEKGFAHCTQCSVLLTVNTKCCYCDNDICSNCLKICQKCDQEFCINCSFPNYCESTAICYTCY